MTEQQPRPTDRPGVEAVRDALAWTTHMLTRHRDNCVLCHTTGFRACALGLAMARTHRQLRTLLAEITCNPEDVL